jgi:hypothetical protein
LCAKNVYINPRLSDHRLASRAKRFGTVLCVCVRGGNVANLWFCAEMNYVVYPMVKRGGGGGLGLFKVLQIYPLVKYCPYIFFDVGP